MRLDHLLSKKKGKAAGLTAGGGKTRSLPVRGSASQKQPMGFSLFLSVRSGHGGMAQLARASALQAEGPGFESLCLQEERMFFDIYSEGTGRIIWSSE